MNLASSEQDNSTNSQVLPKVCQSLVVTCEHPSTLKSLSIASVRGTPISVTKRRNSMTESFCLVTAAV